MRIRKKSVCVCVSCSSFAIHVGIAMQLRSAEGFVLMFPKLGDLGVPPKNPFIMFIDGFSMIFMDFPLYKHPAIGVPLWKPRAEVSRCLQRCSAPGSPGLLWRPLWGRRERGQNSNCGLPSWQLLTGYCVCLCMFMHVYCTRIHIKCMATNYMLSELQQIFPFG